MTKSTEQKPRQLISARLPHELHAEWVRLKDATGKTETELLTEAIAQYLKVGIVPTVPDRVTALETLVEQLRGEVGERIQADGLAPDISMDQAYALATARGYPSSRNSFKDWSLRNRERCESELGLRRFEGTKGKQDELVFLDLRE